MLRLEYEDLHVDEFKEKLKDKETVLIDVRDVAELEEGYIRGYKLINWYSPDFAEKVRALDRDVTYLIYCRSGNRSGQACELMTRMGFKQVYNLNGGILAWNFYKNH